MEDTSSFDSEAELDESRQSVCGDLVDLVGIEPTTSSMPFLLVDRSEATWGQHDQY